MLQGQARHGLKCREVAIGAVSGSCFGDAKGWEPRQGWWGSDGEEGDEGDMVQQLL